MAAGSAFAKAVIQDSERKEPMNQGKSKGVSNYEIIDSGICPKCRGKMRSSDHTENNGFNWYCDHCQLLYKFHDDPGPGAYSTIVLKPEPKVVEEPMNQVGRRCKHGTLLDKYCPECAREDREAEKKEFKPEKGDRILVGVDRSLMVSRIFLYMDRHGRCACVHSDDEEIYNNGSLRFRIVIWPYAKSLPPKLPEFIEGDPIIVWRTCDGVKFLRVVDRVLESGSVKCFGDGALSRIKGNCTWENYNLLPGYDYGGRDVWGSEDNN
jgi:hypothetical protein